MNNKTNAASETTMVSSHSTHGTHEAPNRYAATIVFHPIFSHVGATRLLNNDNEPLEICRNCSGFINKQHPDGVIIQDAYISRKPLTLSLNNNRLDVHLHPGSTPVIINNSPIEPNQYYQFNLEEHELLIELNRRVFIYIHKKNLVDNTPNQLDMLGISDEMQEVRDSILRVADTDIPVLIRGESGIGKELVATALHHYSRRSEHNLVPINVGAIAESLIIAELFGVSKGSFTGATSNKIGFFQQAHNGTLFLDEIGDARDELQLALLRSLETGEVWPVGAAKSIKVDTRFVAATDACLEEKLKDKAFRNPLFQRLSGYEIWISPLRTRKVDIGILITHFLQEHCQKLECYNLLNTNNSSVVAFLSHFYSLALNFSWPGNIRQLSNIVQQVIIHNKERKTNTLPKSLTPLFFPSKNKNEPTVQTDNTADNKNTDKGNHLSSDSNSTSHHQKIDEVAKTPKRKPRNISEVELLDALLLNRYELKNTSETLGISRAAVYKLVESNPNIRKAGDLSVNEIRHCFNECSGNLEKMVDELKVSHAALKRRSKEIGLI